MLTMGTKRYKEIRASLLGGDAAVSSGTSARSPCHLLVACHMDPEPAVRESAARFTRESGTPYLAEAYKAAVSILLFKLKWTRSPSGDEECAFMNFTLPGFGDVGALSCWLTIKNERTEVVSTCRLMCSPLLDDTVEERFSSPRMARDWATDVRRAYASVLEYLRLMGPLDPAIQAVCRTFFVMEGRPAGDMGLFALISCLEPSESE